MMALLRGVRFLSKDTLHVISVDRDSNQQPSDYYATAHCQDLFFSMQALLYGEKAWGGCLDVFVFTNPNTQSIC